MLALLRRQALGVCHCMCVCVCVRAYHVCRIVDTLLPHEWYFMYLFDPSQTNTMAYVSERNAQHRAGLGCGSKAGLRKSRPLSQVCHMVPNHTLHTGEPQVHGVFTVLYLGPQMS